MKKNIIKENNGLTAQSAAKDPAPNAVVIDFPMADLTPEGKGRVMAEANRLADLAPGEWKLWIDGSAEKLRVRRDILEDLVSTIIENREKRAREAAAAQRRAEERAERREVAARREQEREQRALQAQAERKLREKEKAFRKLICLPSEKHDAKLEELAKHLDEDSGAVRDEFMEFCHVESGGAPIMEWHVEAWPEPVPTATLLQELIGKIRKHIMARPHELLAIALWLMMSWLHEIAAQHSAYLVITSAEPESGKTTLLGVLRFLVPKPLTGVEPTGPSVFRVVDREKPTLITDEADDLFRRKRDVTHIFNAGWTRGTKVPRQVQGVTHWFDVFCPKIVGLLGMNLPRALAGRSISIKLRPKRPDDPVVDFSHIDDEEFAALRRKLARWAVDNRLSIREATPELPPDFGNRLAANWHLPLAIAELAGGNWPRQTREAAERLSRTVRKPSLGVQLLDKFRSIFATGRKEITSSEAVAELLSDPDGVWTEYRGGGPITQRQVADLLEQYEIAPTVIHPTRRPSLSRRGYKASQFEDAFAHFLPNEPHIRTSPVGRERRTGKRRGSKK